MIILRLLLVCFLFMGAYTVTQCRVGKGEGARAETVRYGGDSDSPKSESVPLYSYKVANIYPHDRSSFTQGLFFKDGFLYEGTGIHGKSTLRKVELETGHTITIHELSHLFFGEGITLLGDKIVQLTWRSHLGFVYDRDSFKVLQEFTYSTEGWGITYDGRSLVMSDGTPTLHFLNPDTFTKTGEIHVFDKHGPVTRLNELEYVQGRIYANVWPTNRIAMIEPGTGHVVGWVDLQGLLTTQDRSMPVDALNGIAYDSKNDRLFVTGKLWPKLFEIKLVRQKE